MFGSIIVGLFLGSLFIGCTASDDLNASRAGESSDVVDESSENGSSEMADSYSSEATESSLEEEEKESSTEGVSSVDLVSSSTESSIAESSSSVSIAPRISSSSDALSSEESSVSGAELEGWNLVWSDEFNYEGLPKSEWWNFDAMEPGANNGELQRYVEPRLDNARVGDGYLTIEARKENYKNATYTSARLHTYDKVQWTYGRYEIKAILPTGRGVWPAFWMMPSDPFKNATTCTIETGWIDGCDAWPGCGEIDIMEYVTYDPNVVHANLHNKHFNFMNGNNPTGKLTIPGAEAEYHVYAMEWFAEYMEFFIDDQLVMRFDNDGTGWESWPYDGDFYLILNIAVGGDWGAVQGIDETIDSWKLQIDYVRVYQKAG
ncbi:MAG: glycoside hydrolase family 16 protein [Fibrobacterales bacterium]